MGFVYLASHGIKPALLSALIDLSRRFFALPDADKLAIEIVQSPHFRGYTRMAWERTRGAADWREQIDFGAERPALADARDAPAWVRLQGPNQWPASLPELRPLVMQWQSAAAQVLFRALGDDTAAATRFVGVRRDRFAGDEVTIALDGEAELATDGREFSEADIAQLLGSVPGPHPTGPPKVGSKRLLPF